MSRIITSGFGSGNGPGLITMGYGTVLPQVVVDALERPIRLRGGSSSSSSSSSALKHVNEVMAWARMIEYNNREPARVIAGSTQVQVDPERMRVIVELASLKPKETIRVDVRRLN